MASKLKTDVLETVSGSGTIALTNQLSGMTSASMASGSVLQVVEGSSTAAFASTSSSFVDLGLSVSITPTSTSSKIKVEYSLQNIYLAAANNGASFRIVRDSTPLFTPADNYMLYTAAATNVYTSLSDVDIDSPSTTSAVTYKIQMAVYNTNGNITISELGRFQKTIIVTEIKG